MLPVSRRLIEAYFSAFSIAYKKVKKLVPHFAFYTAYLTRSDDTDRQSIVVCWFVEIENQFQHRRRG